MNLGIDLGGTNIAAGLLDHQSCLVQSITLPTRADEGYEAVRDRIIDVIVDMERRALELNSDLESIGIGIPGVASPDGRRAIFCPNLSWNNVPLGSELRERFGLNINLGNDATVAGIAESAYGATKGHKHSIFMTLGTGVGGGIIIDGKAFSGNFGVGSEIGHMVVGENFYDCNCGKNGCLETFSSSTAIVRYTQKLINDGESNTALLENGLSPKNITAKHIFDAAKKGDPLSIKAVQRVVRYLAIGISNMIHLIDPSIIAIGGGMASAGEYLIDMLHKELPNHLAFRDIPHAEIVLSTLGNDAGVIGAAMLSQYI